MITLDLRHAIARAVRDLGQPADGPVRDPAPHLPPELHPDPKLRPGPAPGTYATSIAFGLAAAMVAILPLRQVLVPNTIPGLTRLDLPADPGLTIFTYAAEPGSRSEEALKLLGSWAATGERAESAHATDQC